MSSNTKLLLTFILFSVITAISAESLRKQLELVDITRQWSSIFSEELLQLNHYARKYEAEKAFETTGDVETVSGAQIRDNISEVIIKMMNKTEKAVKRISKHAEELSIYRKPPIFGNSSYQYYNTDNVSNVESFVENPSVLEEIENQWNCDRPTELPEFKCPDSDDRFKREYDSFNYVQEPENTKMFERSTKKPACRNVSYIEREKRYFERLRFKPHPRFDVPINLNHSIIKVMNNIDNRDFEVINGIRFTEALDQTFKCNFDKDEEDPGGSRTSWQYFASQSGFVRYYPATEWSKETYDMTYDFRIRSWYTEALTSPKDIVILMDNSGSIRGNRRLISKVIVNNILDTLTDNDYVNIYTFSNTTSPVVHCFDGSMVQANEENLRLFRENLTAHEDKFASDITVGLEIAFPLLIKHRMTKRRGQICNQAVMLITEGLDYDYDVSIFKKYNSIEGKNYYGPIRIFTYLLGTEPNDGRRMEWIACANMGFYVNISIPDEVQDKVFKYLEVMSRPVNLQHSLSDMVQGRKEFFQPEVAWSAVYIHLADRRLSNWLWKKSEGIRQREIFIKLGKDRMKRLGRVIDPTKRHYITSESHPYMEYETPRKYIFMTTASVPVYDKGPDHMALLGVAAIDVPLENIKKMTKPYKIGVNGYAFILTNNGYVLLHPHHRTTFGKNILKPTYNRVDLTEVEVTTKTLESRKFDDSVIALRDSMVMQKSAGYGKLKIKTSLDDMKRVITNYQHYYYDAIGPFTLAIVLPDKYGNLKVNHPVKFTFEELLQSLTHRVNWTVHPEWEYCRHPKKYDLLDLLGMMRTKFIEQYCKSELTYFLLRDFNATKWFAADYKLPPTRISVGNVISVFVSTHSGLTRWKQLEPFPQWDILSIGDKTIDEVWYKRSVELNFYNNSEMFIYALPFLDSDGDYNNSLVTATHAIFQRGPSGQTPVAVVGYQIRLKALLTMFKEVTKSHCKSAKNCKLSCESGAYDCYIIDNDGYIILHNNHSLLGRSLADVDQILVDHLVKDNILDSITMFDYQGTCFPLEPEVEGSFYGPKKDVEPIINCTLTEIKCKTNEFLTHSIKKTIPTPCDMEHRMYHVKLLDHGTNIEKETSFCTCPYVASRIKGTNLVFLIQRGNCCHFNETLRSQAVVNVHPQEINYNTMSMACYIGTQNNYTIRAYKTCIKNNEVEFELNTNSSYCKIL